jgi:hypothetical protein
MTKDEIVSSTYDGMMILNKSKIDLNIIEPKRGKIITEGLTKTMGLIKKVDEIIATVENEGERNEQYNLLKSSDQIISKSRDFLKKELQVPGGAGIRARGVLKSIIRYLESIF